MATTTATVTTTTESSFLSEDSSLNPLNRNMMMTMMMDGRSEDNAMDDNHDDDDDDDDMMEDIDGMVDDDGDDAMMMRAFLEEADDPIVDPVTEEALNSIVGNVGATMSTTTSTNPTRSARQVSDATHSTHTSSSSPSSRAYSPPATSAGGDEQQEGEPDKAESILQEKADILTEDVGSTVSHTPDPLFLTGRPGIPLYLSCNPDHLSEYQCLIRKNIELFEARDDDISSRMKGRNKPIVLGQVGIRCCHCRQVPVPQRERGSMYFPHSLVGIYQAAQILSQQHLLEACSYVPSTVREELCTLKTKKSYATAGKEYWAATAKVLGVYEDQHGLRFERRLGIVRHMEPH